MTNLNYYLKRVKEKLTRYQLFKVDNLECVNEYAYFGYLNKEQYEQYLKTIANKLIKLAKLDNNVELLKESINVKKIILKEIK